MTLEARAQVHAALGDPYRLAMVEELLQSDRTFQELAASVGLRGNLAAHHLGVLDAAGLLHRQPSEGDGRRRYLSLRRDRLDGLVVVPRLAPGSILFVCTHNSARSQFAAALWHQRTGLAADSAGTEPAARIHPLAVAAAATFGVTLGDARPKGYDEVRDTPDLVISVCDRARESPLPFPSPLFHWSVPDPVRSSSPTAFQTAFALVAERVDRFAEALPPNPLRQPPT